ncbi:MAG: 16S rRNA (cytosine(1402)-N(4))-methyltransferase RsmH [Bacteroidales bacterium]|jgi:16S rRNA (cytosine1402-N4)-methyltransferase|nr:16S rRNA (cytosine(1402)-N(4))-methyltransferase RsmH [Bacteroidales bacterium]MDD2824452.1 16S rRNA (cytosine(1402)-N(4))-methyltransferase RsmH [Bacteroidales bacterium]MDD3100219.1 16S rRNA (cytosine(1402)-N(4))-methyltransferase RsmH [Bacteroidales bacterium]MDD3638870.1 16S rRNA (cytosine(1402)-N(4))-methyltransferase RsmH [Bacteroidales bacterium]MDD3943171.1 16S rRNA (cytosine(1402)-N(4))-methyltransferase RsmH [Bacteroidales bacterium]
MGLYHIPVLLKESIASLAIKPGGIYIDATFGGGGHSRAILEQLGPEGRLLVFDQDPDSHNNLPDDRRITWIQSNFRFIHNFCKHHGVMKADGILADLGVSWHQFDTMERGFSFRFDAPLDMRMNRVSEKTAARVVNEYPREDLANLLFRYGELKNSGALASAIVNARTNSPVNTTGELNRAVERLIPRYAEHKFLAKIYQALRMEVNDEMRALEGMLHQSIPLMHKGGRLVVITYHSLEDRMVKHFIRDASAKGSLRAINKKPVLPAEEEIRENTRARSAKLRVAEKTEDLAYA